MTDQKQDRQKHLLGEQGITRLKNSHVAIYGLGGSGSPIALQLAYLGVGRLTLVDPDVVEESNLNRQLLYSLDDIGELKIIAAKNRIQKIDDDIQIKIDKSHDRRKLLETLETYDVVIDAADNYRFKVILDRECRRSNIPMIHTSAVGMRGTVITFMDNSTSYEKLFDLPSLGRPIEEVSDNEFETRRLKLIPLLVGDFYPKDVLKRLLRKEISWQTLVPAPTIAGGIVVSETIRVLLGYVPMFTPTNPFYFNYSFNRS